MPSVNFFSEKISFKINHPVRIRKWLKEAAASEGFGITQLNYIFTSDKHLHSINKKYLNHDTLTDIITFDNSEGDTSMIEGDIFISIPRVRENAKKYKGEFEVELQRVIIHGLLHLTGYSDKSSTEKHLMRKKEASYLSLF